MTASNIKASNILTDTDGTVKLSDYGHSLLSHMLLRKLGLEENDPRPYWIAPENLRGTSVDIDTRGDIWGIGALTVELTTGRPPFMAETSSEVSELYRCLIKRRKLVLKQKYPDCLTSSLQLARVLFSVV